MPKLIILNGPPRCGKDTGADAIEQFFKKDICAHVKFSQPLKDIACNVFGKSHKILEINKDITQYDCITYRDAQIHTYQQLSKVFGEDWLGRCLYNTMSKMEQPFFVSSDGGQLSEVLALLKYLSPSDIMIVQIMREKCNFAGDIRTYISAPQVRTRPIINNDISVFKSELIDFAGEFFAEG